MSFEAALAPFPDDPEEEIIPYIGPPKLQPVAIKTGEEDEVCLGSFNCKLYRFRNEEWKVFYPLSQQRGQGVLKFLKHKDTKKCRLLMRQDATFFIRANHLITSDIEKSMLHQFGYEWDAKDRSEGVEQIEKFCVKLETQENFDQFNELYEECRIQNIDED